MQWPWLFTQGSTEACKHLKGSLMTTQGLMSCPPLISLIASKQYQQQRLLSHLKRGLIIFENLVIHLGLCMDVEESSLLPFFHVGSWENTNRSWWFVTQVTTLAFRSAFTVVWYGMVPLTWVFDNIVFGVGWTMINGLASEWIRNSRVAAPLLREKSGTSLCPWRKQKRCRLRLAEASLGHLFCLFRSTVSFVYFWRTSHVSYLSCHHAGLLASCSCPCCCRGFHFRPRIWISGYYWCVCHVSCRFFLLRDIVATCFCAFHRATARRVLTYGFRPCFFILYQTVSIWH